VKTAIHEMFGIAHPIIQAECTMSASPSSPRRWRTRAARHYHRPDAADARTVAKEIARWPRHDPTSRSG